MKIKFLLSLLIVFIAQLFAVEKIAVLTFEPSGVDSVAAKNISDRFSYHLSQTGYFDILEREMLDRILEEIKFSESGCVKADCAVEIGMHSAVRKIVAGRISKSMDTWTLSVRYVDVETGSREYEDLEDFSGTMTDFLQNTVRNMALRMAAEVGKSIADDSEKSGQQFGNTERGFVQFTLDQKGAALWVDGKFSSVQQSSAVFLQLSAGSHSIKFTKEGFRDYEKTINIISGEELQYNVMFERGAGFGSANLSTGIVLVNTNPGDAKIYLDGADMGVAYNGVKQMLDVGAGEHIVSVKKNNYYDYDEKVTVLADNIVEVLAKLKPNFGSLSITSEPDGAVIFLNGQMKGTCPLSFEQIQSGPVDIRVSKDMYHAHSERFQISDGSTNERHIQLKPAFGHLAVSSTPGGATVSLDGQFKGKTPEKIGRSLNIDQLPSGTYHLQVSKDLYETVAMDIQITDGITNSQDFVLVERFGRVQVSGTPEGAAVYFNSEQVGRFPLPKQKAPEGQLVLEVKAPNYHAKTEYLTIVRGESYPISTNLERHLGKVQVVTEPPGATFFLDSKRQGSTPKILPAVPTGSHLVRVQHPDFLPQEQQFTLELNEKEDLRFELQTYAGSIQQKIDGKQRQMHHYKWGGIALLALGAAAYLYSDIAYDDYLAASDQDESDKNYMLSRGSEGFGYATAATALYFGGKFTLLSVDLQKLKTKLEAGR